VAFQTFTSKPNAPAYERQIGYDRRTNAENQISGSIGCPYLPERKAELLDMLAHLKPAIAKIAQTHHEDAQSISRFVEDSAHEAAKGKKHPEAEVSHPELSGFVSEYSASLSSYDVWRENNREIALA
jgi:hypothetical protein